MSHITCISAHCGLPGQHVEADDHDETCRGCLPALAADGLLLCRVCVQRLADDALHAATLHAAMLSQLARPSTSGGPAVDGTRVPGLSIPDEVAEARADIHAALRELAWLIADTRGLTRSADEPDQLALHIAAQADWVAAQPSAGAWAGVLRDLRTDPRTWRMAYPARAVRASIGACPIDDCGGRLHVEPGQALVTCPGCGSTGTAEQWRDLLGGDDLAVTDVYAAAARLSTIYQRPVTADTVRNWGWRRQIDILSVADPSWRNAAARVDCRPAPGTRTVALRDRAGRTLYWWSSILARAERLYGQAA